MKKIIAIILGSVLAVSFLQGANFMFAPSSAKADTLTPGATPYPPGSSPPVIPKVEVTPSGQTPGTSEDPDSATGGSAGGGGSGGDGPVEIPNPAPPVYTSPCNYYNGSVVYDPDVAKTCTGTVVKPSGLSYDFSCPAQNGLSAIYITYNYKEWRNINYVKITSNGTYPPTNKGWNRYVMGGTYYFSSLGGKYKILEAKGYATDTQFIDGQLWGWEWTWTVGTLDWTSKQSELNTLYDIAFNWKGYQTFRVQSDKVYYQVDNVNCVYPYKPEVKDLYSVTCFVSYDTYFYQSQSKAGIVPPGGQLLDMHRDLPAGSVAKISTGKSNNWGVTMGNHMNCNNDSLNGYDSYNVKSPEEGGYGYYRVSADVFAVKCFIEGYPRWTQNNSKDKIRGCTDVFKYNTFHSYAVYSCSGFLATGQGSGAWGALPNNVNFAVSACETFGCTITGSLQIGDTSSALQVMRNGENIRVRYPSVSIQASGNSRPLGASSWEEVIEAASGVQENSSPFYGNSTNNSKQYFSLRTADDKSANFLNARSAGAVTSANSNPSSAWQSMLINGAPNPNFSNGYVRFTWASDSNKNWKMFRAFRIKAEFFVPISNTTDGSTYMGWQEETKYCGEVSVNQLSNPITVVRSINELQQ